MTVEMTRGSAAVEAEALVKRYEGKNRNSTSGSTAPRRG
jgi:hypothetical protein